MERVPEPELMDDGEQARAYSEADFAEPHEAFVDAFQARFPDVDAGVALDLGCGPADVTARLARRLPALVIDGIDGAEAMLALGRARLAAQALASRVTLRHGYVPGCALPRAPYDVVVSNSLLHHLAAPLGLWTTVKAAAAPGAAVFVMDLMRPESRARAEWMVEAYAKDEPPVLQRDFFASLLAAYTTDEIRAQLDEAGLPSLAVEAISDRHLVVWGRRPAG